ncbi:MAG TPA: Omp28-related outer membrane protein [Chitinophagales bacterium]|nr:Omp28-related outer membrane protein [Chitinophagales bacterium]
MLKRIAPLFLFFLPLQIFAQSPKTVLFEHFTNTKCSICASRNPGFYSVLSGYPQVLHIAFHPSSPYASCYFSLQNAAENNDRTNFYNVFGSTPRFVLNGKILPSADPVITTTTIDTTLNQTSPVEISDTEELVTSDSVKVRVVVRTTGAITDPQMVLFAGATQDTVQYSAGNGEQLHHDVFRKALTKAKGDTINLPALNDSVVFFFAYKIQPGWREPNMNTIAWLQTTDTKRVLNADKSHRVVTPAIVLGQSPKTVLIEHFTNTKCSICASRNPGFYSTLSGYSQVIHIAFHPSAPYNSCYFNLQNVAENDSRTNYYGIYGSTPQFVLNGKHLPSANPAITATTIDTALNQTASIEVSATQELQGSDSIISRVVIRTTGTITEASLLLFAGVTQDTIQYSAGNGEQLHHDVFRRALTQVTGDAIQVPAIDDSLVLNFTYKIEAGWRTANLNTIAWLQLSNSKQVLNAVKSNKVTPLVSSIRETEENNSFSVYPNPVGNTLHISGNDASGKNMVDVFNLLGSKIFSEKLPATNFTINTTNWTSGVYFVRIGNATKRIVKE